MTTATATLHAANVACVVDTGMTPDEAIAALETVLDASLAPTPPTPAPAAAGSLPADGAVIVFDVVPVASWATAGVPYRVEREGRSFRFQNVRTGSATFDRDWAVARSTWRHA